MDAPIRFRATLMDGRVYGLGACNCKSSMAVHLWLAREIARRGGPKARRGGLHLRRRRGEPRPRRARVPARRGRGEADTLIVAAQTRNRLVLEERGVMWVRVTTRGKAAHAGRAAHRRFGDPADAHGHRRDRARARAPVARQASASGQQSTLSIGRIRGGENTNVVPDQCAIEIDRRILPEEDFDGALAELGRSSLRRMSRRTRSSRAPHRHAGLQRAGGRRRRPGLPRADPSR